MPDYVNVHLDRDDFNQRIGGGLPKGSLMIIEGEEGIGKSIISQRITYGALINGHSVTYISTEMNTIDFVREMRSVKYDVIPFILDKKLLFLTLLPVFGKVKKGRNMIHSLKKATYLFKNEIFILDSLSYPLIDSLTKQELFEMIQFLNKMKSRDRLIILTYDPAVVDPEIVNELRRIADIYFKLGFSSLAGQQTRYIEIRRYRNAKDFFNPMIPYRVEPGLGFIVEIVTVV